MILRTGNNNRNFRFWILDFRFHSKIQNPKSKIRPASVFRGGLTLVEVLVSVVIIAIGTVVVMQALARVAQAQVVADDRVQASLVASAKMVEAELATVDGTPLSEHDGGHLRVNEQPFDWTLSAAASAEDPQVQAITLAVSWSRGQKTYRQEVSTLVRLPKESQ